MSSPQVIYCVYAVIIFNNLNVNAIGPISQQNEEEAKTYNKRITFCPLNTQCVPLSSCPFLINVLNNNCVLRNKFNDLKCGYQGSSTVCCPQLGEPSSILSVKNVNGQRCGISQVQSKKYFGLGAFPWAARIGFQNILNGEIIFPCTGSIISRSVILTAAHCGLAKSDNFKLYLVKIGEWNTDTDIDCSSEFCGLPTQDIVISHIIVHPRYRQQTFQNNIALIILKSLIHFSVTAQPICLPESWFVSSSDGLLIGWGKTAQQIDQMSKQQILRLPIIGLQQCVDVYGRTLPVTDDEICVGGESGNDACSGFGGAPLIVKANDTYYQVGILSFGSEQCGSPGIPSVYTNIKKYISWIKENMLNI